MVLKRDMSGSFLRLPMGRIIWKFIKPFISTISTYKLSLKNFFLSMENGREWREKGRKEVSQFLLLSSLQLSKT